DASAADVRSVERTELVDRLALEAITELGAFGRGGRGRGGGSGVLIRTVCILHDRVASAQTLPARNVILITETGRVQPVPHIPTSAFCCGARKCVAGQATLGWVWLRPA